MSAPKMTTRKVSKVEKIYWSDLAELTHETQVEKFGFCICEEQEDFPYADCPKEGA